MSTYVLTIQLTEDGVPLSGFPVQKSLTTTENGGKQVFTRANADGTFTELPIDELGVINLLYLTGNEAFAVRLNDQSDGEIPINSGGILLLFDCAIPSDATSKAALENDSGNTVTVTMIAGGA